METRENLLDKMSLIDEKYVAEAGQVRAGRHWRKAAVAAVAALTVGVLCLSFQPQVRAFAEEFLGGRVRLSDGNSFEGKMDFVEMNPMTREQLTAEYYTMDEVSELMGVPFLRTSLKTEKPVPTVDITGWIDGGVVEVKDHFFYMHDEILIDPTKDEHVSGDGWFGRIQGENPYTISYTATFLRKTEQVTTPATDVGYDNSRFVENYTTANGLKAGIFHFDSYHAVIYRDNVMHLFEMEHDGSLDDFKAFLDTLY